MTIFEHMQDISWSIYPGVELLDEISIFVFTKDCQIIFQDGCTNYTAQVLHEGSHFPHLHQCLYYLIHIFDSPGDIKFYQIIFKLCFSD